MTRADAGPCGPWGEAHGGHDWQMIASSGAVYRNDQVQLAVAWRCRRCPARADDVVTGPEAAGLVAQLGLTPP